MLHAEVDAVDVVAVLPDVDVVAVLADIEVSSLVLSAVASGADVDVVDDVVVSPTVTVLSMATVDVVLVSNKIVVDCVEIPLLLFSVV